MVTHQQIAWEFLEGKGGKLEVLSKEDAISSVGRVYGRGRIV